MEHKTLTPLNVAPTAASLCANLNLRGRQGQQGQQGQYPPQNPYQRVMELRKGTTSQGITSQGITSKAMAVPADTARPRAVIRQQGYGAPGGYGAPPSVPNYLIWSILSTLFCCLPAGIVAIVYASQVDGKLRSGDYEGAVQSSNNAKTWTMVSAGLGLVVGIIYFIAAIAGGLN